MDIDGCITGRDGRLLAFFSIKRFDVRAPRASFASDPELLEAARALAGHPLHRAYVARRFVELSASLRDVPERPS
ncbi:hypothetical protein AB4Y36_38210 [Paraburkholderia sp. BR10936]|uniref:hypothetical protein n=1 Tax=Paraburkholderia sp. BR10936 TaxID=3236993 RepID=UPI0034D158C7